MDTETPLLSVVIPMYNEQEAFPVMVERLRPILDQLGETYEVLAVDDGSSDATFGVLQVMRRKWPQLRVIRLRRNSGHQAALTAGLKQAYGSYVVSIDADLQDPPEKISEMLRLAQGQGLDIVYGVRVGSQPGQLGKALLRGALLPPDAPARGRRSVPARGRLPAAEPRRRRGPPEHARAPARLSPAGALDRLSQRRGHVRPGRAGGGAHKVPTEQDGAARRRQRHQLLRRSLRIATWLGRAASCSAYSC